jgi:hypothetical protein
VDPPSARTWTGDRQLEFVARPDGVTIDPNGNLSTLTPPGRPAHSFTYTPVDLEASYVPPDIGIGGVTTSDSYNLDRQLELVTRPDGVTIDPAYDLGRRLALIAAGSRARFVGRRARYDGLAKAKGVVWREGRRARLFWPGPIRGV